MDAGRMINMVLRMVLRPLINKGINAGIARVSKGRGAASPEEEQAHKQQSAQTAKRARQAMRVTRKIGRF